MTDQRSGYIYLEQYGYITVCCEYIVINLFAIGTFVQVRSICCRTSHNYFKVQIILLGFLAFVWMFICVIFTVSIKLSCTIFMSLCIVD